MLQRHVDLRPRRGVGPPEQLPHRLAVGQRRHAVLREHPLHERAVLLRDHRLELLDELLRIVDPGARVRGGHHDVDTVWLAVDVLVHPRQLLVQLLRREPQRAEHAEAAGARDLGRHLLVHGERVDGMLDPELLGQRRSDAHVTRSFVATDLAHG